jgi:uncharacterized protein (DUF885 family)
LGGCQTGQTSQLSEPRASPTLTEVLPPANTQENEEPLAAEKPLFKDTSDPSEAELPADAAQTLAVRLAGLSLSEFFEISFQALTLRSPESVVAFGLTEVYGVEDVLLDDISEAYQQETYQVLALILETLESYNQSSLSPKKKISYDVYHWYLKDQLSSEEFMLYDYPATYYPVTSVHEDLLQFFTDIHPIRDMQDAKDYLTRLSLADRKIAQLINNLEQRVQAGITPPQFAIQWAVYGSLGEFVETPPERTRLYTAFKEKLDLSSSIKPDDKEALLVEAESIINEEVLPAYRDLFGFLRSIDTYYAGDSGVWRLPKGAAYYANRLHHFTTTDLSAESIHQLGLDELDRIHAEMRRVFDQLGYPHDLTLAEAYDRVAQKGGHISGDEVLRTYESLIAEADQELEVAFNVRPKAAVIVVPDPYGDYYVHPSIDGSRPGAFYAGVGDAGKEAYAMPTLAYHETIPGHHLQIALAQEMKSLPSFRQGLTFSAYTEGWALYAEQLAYELGWYHENPYGHLGFLQGQAFRAARLVVDTGLHAMGWTFEQAQEFLTENTGFEVGDNVNPRFQIARYLVWPGQATSYYVGYLKILELRQSAKQALGERFDLKEFHRVVLTNGSLPLEVLETVVEAYIRREAN